MRLRQKFNEGTRVAGNKIKQGLGDILTREIDLEPPLTVAGAVVTPIMAGKALCNYMYDNGIVQAMYSENFIERVVGTATTIPIGLVWIGAILPLSLVVGTGVGNYIGRQLDRI